MFADAETPRIGAGLGVRYYTALGPIRLDVGVPVNRGGSGSPVVKIYVSLGQAF
jgi:translocation and assembly module TamA